MKTVDSPKKTAFIIGLMVLGLLCAAQTPLQVEVIIDNANIRSQPELDAEILDIVPKGAVFEVIEKAGPWYVIKIGEDETGKAVYGYIHESMVEPRGEIRPKPKDRVERQPSQKPQPVPPPPPPETKKPALPPEMRDAQPTAGPLDRPLSGSFLKCGFIDHWVVSFGYDFGIGRHVGIGLEFQPYFKSLSDIERSFIQMDIFANLKLGFRLWVFTVYGGGGVGPDFSYTSTVVGDETSSQFKTMLAYHGVAGLAVDIGRMSIVLEYQPRLISNPDLNPDTWDHFLFIGLRF